MATLTSTAAVNSQPKTYHVGVQCFASKQLFTGTAASVLKLAKLPNNATIVGGYIAAPADGFDLEVGDEQSASRYLGVVQVSSAAKYEFSAIPGLSYKIDLSDSAQPQFTWLQATIGSASATGTFHWAVFYTMDQ